LLQLADKVSAFTDGILRGDLWNAYPLSLWYFPVWYASIYLVHLTQYYIVLNEPGRWMHTVLESTMRVH